MKFKCPVCGKIEEEKEGVIWVRHIHDEKEVDCEPLQKVKRGKFIDGRERASVSNKCV